MKRNIFVLSLLLSILFLTALSAQDAPDARVEITDIRLNGVSIDASDAAGLELEASDLITFYFECKAGDEVITGCDYKLFLNGKMIKRPSPGVDHHTFRDLNPDKYTFQARAVLPDGSETARTSQTFLVMLAKPTSVETPFYESMLFLIVLGAVILIQLIIILILAFRRRGKEGAVAPLVPEEQDNMKYLYDRLKTEHKKIKERNVFLEEKIESLELNIKELEKANLHLLSQKEKLVESKQQLEELQKQKDEYFAITMHDLKNPAGTIKGLVELLESYDLNANEQQEVMQSLISSSSHIVDLAQAISLMMASARPELGLKMKHVAIKDIIDVVCVSNKAYAKQKMVKLVNKSSIDTPQTVVDENKIEEVIDNLVNNAIKFAPENTIVQVRTYFNDSSVTVEVVDNGVGLSADDLKRVFSKGAKLSAKPTGDEQSSGLGLWIVKKIVEEHGGKVKVKSKVGVGSSFGFEIPIRSSEEEEANRE